MQTLRRHAHRPGNIARHHRIGGDDRIGHLRVQHPVRPVAFGQALIAPRAHQRIAAGLLERAPKKKGFPPVAVDHIRPEILHEPPHIADKTGKSQRIFGVERQGQRLQPQFLRLAEGVGTFKGHHAAFMPGGVEQARQFHPVPCGSVEPADIDHLNRAERRHRQSGKK